MSKTYPVVELFGPTIQGEGAMTGTLTHFIRLGGCSLRCTWCDSMHAVLPENVKANAERLTIDEIVAAVLQRHRAPWVTLTGGDPCIHEGLDTLIHALNAKGMRVAVETQGSLFPEWLPQVDMLTFSPKGPSSGNIVDTDGILNYLQQHPGVQETCIKVVIAGRIDMRYAMNALRKLRPYVTHFWFTAVSPINEPPKPEEFQRPEEYEARVEDWARSRESLTMANYRELAREVLTRDMQGYDVRIGCQQHTLLWPGMTKGA